MQQRPESSATTSRKFVQQRPESSREGALGNWRFYLDASQRNPRLYLDNRSQYGIIKGLEVVIMRISTDIKPVTYLKSRAADMLKQVNETHRPIVITQNGEPKAVLQDPESYENMRNTIGMLKLISLGEEDIRNGKSKMQSEVFSDLEKLLGS